MKRNYYILDVFTETAFAGNPLAVVRGAEGMSGERMQAVAREFNLSETVFVLPSHDPVNTARIRIFTPQRELPFAGHPTIGTAVLIAQLDAPGLLSAQDLSVVLEEEVGNVACTVAHRKGRAPRASFQLPTEPKEVAIAPDDALIAAALGLEPDDIGFEKHFPTIWSAGLGFTFVPVRSMEAIGRARPVMSCWANGVGPADHPNAFLYTRDVAREGSAFHARMFAPSMGVTEDPATGSAVAAFAGAIMQFENPTDGNHVYVVEQGFEMGRPSLITLGIDVEERQLVDASIGGAAVLVAQGTIDV